MNASCTICLENLTEDKCPMTTLCGHLYCLDDATYHFAQPNATCAICRRPHALESMIKLYPNYVVERNTSSRSAFPSNVLDTGRSALNACHQVLQTEDMIVFDTSQLALALSRTDDLVYALAEYDAPDIRNLMNSIISSLSAIRSKVDEATRVPALLEERSRLLHLASKLRTKYVTAVASREADRRRVEEELRQQRSEWATRASELQQELHETSSLLSAEKAKLDAAKTVALALNDSSKKWRARADLYKKKYTALKKEHNAVKNAIDDVFFPEQEEESLIVLE